MTTVRLDRVEGSSLRHSAGGLEATRIVQVSGLRGVTGDALLTALYAAGVPRLGERHPGIDGARVCALDIDPDGPDAATVRVHYRRAPAQEAVQLDTQASHRVTEVDRHGRRITVSHPAPEDPQEMLSQGVRVTVLAARTVLRISRLEPRLPLQAAQRYVGAVNRLPFFDGSPGQWLCTAITGTSDDAGRSYLTHYEFQFACEGWQPVVSYEDPETGRPPANLVEGVGVKQVEVYPSMDFRALALS